MWKIKVNTQASIWQGVAHAGQQATAGSVHCWRVKADAGRIEIDMHTLSFNHKE